MADQPENVVPEQTPVADQQPEVKQVDVGDQFKELLASIKTEDGRQKYDSIPKALESIPHANEHISTLQKEMAALREELAKRKTAEELIERIENQKTNTTEPTSRESIDLSQIDELVSKKLADAEAEKKAKSNISSVVNKLQGIYGEKAEEVFYSKAKEAGLDVAAINYLAKTSPAAALKIVGVDTASNSAVSKPTSSINTEALQNTNGQKPSNKIKSWASTSDMVAAWRASKVE